MAATIPIAHFPNRITRESSDKKENHHGHIAVQWLTEIPNSCTSNIFDVGSMNSKWRPTRQAHSKWTHLQFAIFFEVEVSKKRRRPAASKELTRGKLNSRRVSHRSHSQYRTFGCHAGLRKVQLPMNTRMRTTRSESHFALRTSPAQALFLHSGAFRKYLTISRVPYFVSWKSCESSVVGFQQRHLEGHTPICQSGTLQTAH